jgi:hypothetical protein
MLARLAVIVLGVVSMVASTTGAQAAPTGTTLAVTGLNKALYVQGPGPDQWTNLGGARIAAPAVAVSGGLTHYVGIGTNGRLYHRTTSTGWAVLAPADLLCAHVAAVAIAGTVTAACTATADGSVRTVSFPGTATQPYDSAPVNWGGVVYGPVAIVNDAGTVRVIARGAQYLDSGGVSNTYTKTQGGSWAAWHTFCQSPPGAVFTANLKVVACQTNPDYVLIETGSASGEWHSLTVAGRTPAAPGAAATASGATVFVVGTNSSPYYRPVSFANPGPGWTKMSGLTTFTPAASAA